MSHEPLPARAAPPQRERSDAKHETPLSDVDADRPAPHGGGRRSSRRKWAAWLVVLTVAIALAGIGARRYAGRTTIAGDQESQGSTVAGQSGDGPVARDRTAVAAAIPTPAPHPLEPALKIARQGLQRIRADVRDYTCVIIKRERIGGKLLEAHMMLKIRNRQLKDREVAVPFSVYMKFLQPSSVTGREVIWVEGHNDGKLIAHEAGLANLLRARLDPNGFLAMMGNRYPINHIGIENLVEKLIDRGQRDDRPDECELDFIKDQKVDGRRCTLLQITHKQQRPDLNFRVAKIYIDDEWNVPLRYSAYQWPETPGGEPPLDEEYIYTKMKLNVGLTDADFDPDNPNYDFP